MELAIILMMLLIVVAVGAIKLNDGGLAFPFKKRPTLFTKVECSFLELLEEAVGDEYRVMCRIRLTDIISLRQNTDKKTARTAMGRASGRHLDFVLCNKLSMDPVVAIDLVHQKGTEGYKSQRDWFVSGALDAARIPHLRIKVKSGYKPKDIRDCVEAKLAPIRNKVSQEPIVKGTQYDDPAKPPTRPLRSNRPMVA